MNEPIDMRFSVAAVAQVFVFPALGGLLFGYDIGATSYVVPQLGKSGASGVAWHNIIKDSAVLQGAITSGGVAGALIGALIVFRVADTLGRRRELLVGSVLYAAGALLELASGGLGQGTPAGLGLTLLLLGRLVYGIGCGFAMHGAPAYIGEMAPASIRGRLISMKEAVIVGGICLGYAVGFALERVPHGWQLTYGLAVPIALVMGLGAARLPPSARWLALRGEDPEPSLRFVFPNDREAVRSALDDVTASDPSVVKDVNIAAPQYRKPLVAGLGVVLLQQLTGQPSVLYYATSIFDDAGIGAVATVFVGVFKLLATVSAVYFVDTRGRLPLLLSGIGVMAIALVLLAITAAGFAPTYFLVAFIFVYIAGYQWGFGPIAWLLIAEIFPLQVRGQAVALAVQINFAANLLVTFLFPVCLDALNSLVPHLGLSLLFAVFAIIDIYAFVFVKRYVPETKGLSLEDIESFFRQDHALLDEVPTRDAPLLA